MRNRHTKRQSFFAQFSPYLKYGLLSSVFMMGTLGNFQSVQAADLLKSNSNAIKPVSPVQNLPNFVNLVKQVKPAVVSINSHIVLNNDDDQGEDFPDNGNMMPFPLPFPFQMLPQQMQKQTVEARGSGFIISSDGYVVTNNHVVKEAKKITVTLGNGEKYPAKVIGRDAKTDLALLKISSEKPFPFIQLGDSNGVEPGEWVIAVGDPYGLGGTVTAGIVSARGRDIGETPYDSFIQVDAPINRGNSGGPLFSQDGKVIGVNTAILSPSGGSIGIGFAIPSNTVKTVIAQLEKNGHVTRGYLGVMAQLITPSMVKSLKLPVPEHGLAPEGALIASLAPNSPAEKSGLEIGDVILSLNGNKIDSPKSLANQIANIPPGTVVILHVLRDGVAKDFKIQIANMNDMAQKKKEVAKNNSGSLGIIFSILTPELKQQVGVDEKTKGVLIMEVKNNSPAERAGLQAGDVVMSVNNHAVETPNAVTSLITNDLKTDKTVLLRVLRGEQSLFVPVTLGDTD